MTNSAAFKSYDYEEINFDDINFSDDYELTGSKSKKENSKSTSGTSVNTSKTIRAIKIFVAVMCGFLAFESLLFTVVIPCTAPAKIVYSGLNMFSKDQFSQLLKTVETANWMQFDSKKAAILISSVPGVEDVVVEKHFPDKVVIKIKERVPVAKTLVNLGNKVQAVQIDKNGVLFPVQKKEILEDTSVPLVTGLPVDKIKNEMRLSEKYRSLMDQISQIKCSKQNYFSKISEIQVVPAEFGSYELVIYPVDSKVKVYTDRSLDEDALKYMMVALDVVNSIEPDVRSINLRYGVVSYSKNQ